MSRPSKPVTVLEFEKRSHRTKAEISARRESEDALITGQNIQEWPRVRSSPGAHREFQRLRKLLKKIEKNDALFQSVINRYCLLKAECEEFEEKRERFLLNMEEMSDAILPEDRDLGFYATQAKMQSTIISCDKQIMAKRKMMLDIEKENIMTIAAALRSIPKKPDQAEEDDPMAKLLGNRRA